MGTKDGGTGMWGHMGTQPCVTWGHCEHGDKGWGVTRTGWHHGGIFGSAGDTVTMGTKDGGTGMGDWDGG